MVPATVFLSIVFLFSLFTQRIEKTPFTAPMIFTAAGLLLAVTYPILQTQIPSISPFDDGDPTLLLIGELTLVVVLFNDATRLQLHEDALAERLIIRLLAVGMPLAIVIGALMGMFVLGDLSIWNAAILATILAPTDATLGLAVVNSEWAPRRIRQALSVEAGLNDGLSVPFLVLFIGQAIVGSSSGLQSWLWFAVQQIAFGVLAGFMMGGFGGMLMVFAVRRGWMARQAYQLAMLSLAVLAWALAEHGIHGNGFIAAFCAGIGLLIAYHTSHEERPRFDEAWVDLLIYFVFFYFGMVAVPWLHSLTWRYWLYAALSLTLVRMGAVALAMLGIKLQWESVLFLGWFGPRGLASVVLVLIYLQRLDGFTVDDAIVLATVATVLLSIVAHGLSAVPGARRYGSRLDGRDLGSDTVEYRGA